jgi:hypothetical protein
MWRSKQSSTGDLAFLDGFYHAGGKRSAFPPWRSKDHAIYKTFDGKLRHKLVFLTQAGN